MNSPKHQNINSITKFISSGRKSVANNYLSKNNNSTMSMYGDIDFECDQNQDNNKKQNREYLKQDALVYSADFEEYIRSQREKEGSISQMHSLQISKLIDQAEKKSLTLESPEILEQNFTTIKKEITKYHIILNLLLKSQSMSYFIVFYQIFRYLLILFYVLIQKILKLIMNKPIMRRNDKEQRFIWKYMQTNSFFYDLKEFYPTNVMLELCKNMKVEEYNSTQKVFSQVLISNQLTPQKYYLKCLLGDNGNKFYVLLEGQTAVFTDVKKHEKENLITFAIQKILIKVIQQELNVNLLQLPDISPISKILHQSPNQMLLGSHEKGQYFGEIALRNECPRTASIYAKTNIILAVIQGSDYRNIVQSFEDLQLEKNISFLKTFSIFQNFKQNNLQEIWYLCKEQKYERGQNIYEEDENASCLYLIKEGEILITKTVENNIKNTEKTQNIPKKLIHMNGVWNNEINDKKKEKIIVSRLGKNQYFGELELIQKKSNKRLTTATCETASIIYSLHKKLLLNIFSQIYTQNQINKIFSLRGDAYKQQIYKVVDERNKRRDLKQEHDIVLDTKNDDSIKVNFNKLRIFSTKRQFLQEHLNKMYNSKNTDDPNQEKKVHLTQTIQPEKNDKDDLNTSLSNDLVAQMMEFFKNHNFAKEDDKDISFLQRFLQKQKNPFLIRLQQMQQSLKKGKPTLKQQMGDSFKSDSEIGQLNVSSQNMNSSQSESVLNLQKQGLLKLMRRHQIKQEQFSKDSLTSSQNSSSLNIFKLTNESQNMNILFDEVITTDFREITPIGNQNKINFSQNNLSIQSQNTSPQNNLSKHINLDSDLSYHVIPSCYNHGIRSDTKIKPKPSSSFTGKFQNRYKKEDNQQSLELSQLNKSLEDKSFQNNSFSNKSFQYQSIQDQSLFSPRCNDKSFTLPKILNNSSSIPHFAKIQKKANIFKQVQKNVDSRSKLKII